MTKNKNLILVLLILASPLLGAIYGILHDQISYTVSPEYYTRFKFIQFEIIDEDSTADITHPRLWVSVVGCFSTWWMGLLIGVVLGLVGLRHKDRLLFVTVRALLLTITVAFAAGLLGLAMGKFLLPMLDIHWHLPENVADPENFIAVGAMHNFSYLGGILGLVLGVVYSIRHRYNSPQSSIREGL